MKNIIDECVHQDLELFKKAIHENCGLAITNIVKEAESEEYGAYKFEVANKHVVFRVAKTTPKKIGQFVTFWKRDGDGPIMPFDATDQFDYFIVSIKDTNRFGFFIFSKLTLEKNGVVTTALKAGKRAIRVYPPWVTPDSAQAKNSQKWQQACFWDASGNNTVLLKLQSRSP